MFYFVRMAINDTKRGLEARGRASKSNCAGRFETHERDVFDDGWEISEAIVQLRTEVSVERPQICSGRVLEVFGTGY